MHIALAVPHLYRCEPAAVDITLIYGWCERISLLRIGLSSFRIGSSVLRIGLSVLCIGLSVLCIGLSVLQIGLIWAIHNFQTEISRASCISAFVVRIHK